LSILLLTLARVSLRKQKQKEEIPVDESDGMDYPFSYGRKILEILKRTISRKFHMNSIHIMDSFIGRF